MSLKPINIVGGGLAGLTLGIGLRQAGIPVTVWEAGHYPRHRVCGEFISGRGQAVLERFGLSRDIREAGAIDAHTARFVFPTARSPVRALPVPAWSISRFALDGLLADQFRRLSGELREGERWAKGASDEGVVRASGRRSQAAEGGFRWFGLKVHARNLPLTADLEMHALRDGYLGLTRLKDGEVNVCGLFRRAAEPGGLASERAGIAKLSPVLLRVLENEPPADLEARLRHAEVEETSSCAVAGLGLRPRPALPGGECCLGDALTMIPPVTGNGMSMAFEAAELALAPLAAWSRGTLGWSAAQKTIARQCDEAFGRRLAWARSLQWLMFAPTLRGRLGALLLRSEWLWQFLFARTR